MTDSLKSFKPLEPAVLFIVFNRPDTTEQVFEAIRVAKPPRLYIAADGPRANYTGDLEKVAMVRKIATSVDWLCEVKTLFREDNLGCKHAVSGGINWFFENEEQGIILEDDCLPSKSFFWFCEDLLNKYKYEDRVMHIAGMTYEEKADNIDNYSYHFCKVGGIWGWASWRRAWKKYELEMNSYDQAIKDNIFDNLFYKSPKIKNFYLDMFYKAYGNTHTWDYQWTFTKIINNSINIMPAKNLVKNIGFNHKDAAHTTSKQKKYLDMKLNELQFPLKHLRFIVVDEKFNYKNFMYVYDSSLKNKLIRILRLIIPKYIVKLIKKIIKK